MIRFRENSEKRLLVFLQFIALGQLAPLRLSLSGLGSVASGNEKRIYVKSRWVSIQTGVLRTVLDDLLTKAIVLQLQKRVRNSGLV